MTFIEKIEEDVYQKIRLSSKRFLGNFDYRIFSDPHFFSKNATIHLEI